MIFDFRDISRAMKESTSSQCQACFLPLKNLKSMKKHKAVCSIKICGEDVEHDLIVRDNEESERVIDKGTHVIVYHSSNPVSICFLNCGNNLS